MADTPRASRTAVAVAYMRAAHQLFDAAPRMLDDPVAVALLGADAEQRLRDAAQQYRSPERLALRSHVVLRSRFAEDRLAAAVERGVTQYVILGAGLDTFALRQPPWVRALSILEVDHPGTQAMKRSHLGAAGFAMPDNAEFAQIDFAHESLRDGLLRYRYSLRQRTFFSWLGVTMYLREPAIDALLRAVAEFPEGSEIALSFAPPPGDVPSPYERRAAELGEPWVSHFTPDEIDAKLRDCGFSEVVFLTPEEADARYYSRYPSELPLPKHTTIAAAVR